MRTRSAILVAVVIVLAVLAGTWLLLGWLTPAGEPLPGRAGADEGTKRAAGAGTASRHSSGLPPLVGQRSGAGMPRRVADSGPDSDRPKPPVTREVAKERIEDLIARLDQLAEKFRAQTWRHSPTGTDLEAFYLSLPDDGVAWAKLLAIGSELEKAFEKRNSDLYNLDVAFRAASERGVAHLELKQELQSTLPTLTAALRAFLEAPLPQEIYLMPTRAMRSRGERSYAIVDAIRISKALRMYSLALLRTGQPAAGLASVRRLIQTGHVLRGTNLLDMMIIVNTRQRNLDFLISCFEAKLVDSDLVRELYASHLLVPQEMESVLIGEAVGVLSELDKLRADPLKQGYTLEEVMELIDSLESVDSWIGDALDPLTIEGRLLRGGSGVRVSELAELSDRSMTKQVVLGLFMQSCKWDLLATAAGFLLPENVSFITDEASTDMLHLTRMLRGGEEPSAGGGSRRTFEGLKTSFSKRHYILDKSWPAWETFPEIRHSGFKTVVPDWPNFGGTGYRSLGDGDLPERWFNAHFAGSSKPVMLRLVTYDGPTGEKDQLVTVLAEIFTSYEENLREGQ